MTTIAKPAAALLLILAFASSGLAQKKPLDHSVYDSWRGSVTSGLSRDGRYLVWGSRPAKGDPDLNLVDLESDRSTPYPKGTAPRFTHDGKFLLFTAVPAEADVEKAKKEKKKPEEMPKNALVIVDLTAGSTRTIERLSTYSLAEEGSGWIALRTEPTPVKPPAPPTPNPEVKPEPTVEQKPGKRQGHAVGKELTLLELTSGREIKLSDVSDFTWQKGGAVLVYSVSTKDGKGDGVFRFEPGTGKTIAIAEGMATYKSLTVHEGGNVVYMSELRTYTEKVPSWDLYLWRPGGQAKSVVAANSDAFPDGWEVTDGSGVRFSEKGKRLLFSTREKPTPEDETKTEIPADEKVAVDVWNWKDVLIQPMQLRRAAGARSKSFQAMLDIGSGRILQLETEDIPSISLADQGDGDIAIGTNSDIYGPMVSYDGTYSDYYLIDLRNGKRTLVKKQSGDGIQLSPTGKWMAWFDSEKGTWNTRRSTSTAQAVVASAGVPHPLFDELHDSPDLPNSYGLVGWTPDESTLLVNDGYDIWALSADGRKAPVSITKGYGRERSIRLRATRTDREARHWPLNEPILLAGTNMKTKATGYYYLQPGGAIEELIYGDYDYTYSTKADDADVVLMTRQRFDEYPDIWTTNLKFENAKKRTDINPQMRDYSWGRAELTEWMSDDGAVLQGVLYKPDNYDPRKRYPTIVYFYERLSQQLHSFFGPGPGSSSVSIPFYVSRGYVVFTPDIPYEVGYPGESAESAIVPGVLSLIEKGIADPKRIGMQGHSWGGYQVCHLVTRTNLFACAEAGAPVANMFSAYGGIRWGTGMSRQFQYEKTQSRIGGTIWDKPLQFIENSPVFWADRVRTPLLILHNDQDGAVPWYQGIEMYMALRRLNKPVWLFNYNGEDHGIGKIQNKKDWAVRMQQFFDHYLMDAPAPAWLKDGVPAVKKGEELGLATGGGG
ncbi:MAG: prolyl oligopeptidase family serine peptidase [Armatimonadota bacterium]|nr:prolyl oligopeptidase family serine peptidase [Armatimonadota bacterium]